MAPLSLAGQLQSHGMWEEGLPGGSRIAVCEELSRQHVALGVLQIWLSFHQVPKDVWECKDA